MLTMDQEYVNRFSVRSVTLQQRLLQGVQALGVGAYEGILGMLFPGIALFQAAPWQRSALQIFYHPEGHMLQAFQHREWSMILDIKAFLMAIHQDACTHIY